MAVHVDIDTQFNQRSVLQSANDMHRNLQRQGDETADRWAQSFEKAGPRVRKAYENAYQGAANASSKLRSEEAKLSDVRRQAQNSADKLAEKEARLTHFRTNLPNLTDTIAAKERELVTIRDRHSSILSQLTVRSEAFARAQMAQGSALSSLGSAFSSVESGASGAATSLGSIGRFGAPTIAVLAGVAVELTAVASAASGLVGLLPSVIGGAAAAFGTLKLATVGFDQALKDMGDTKKFNQDLQGLSPAAQQAALAIQQLMPAFTQLKNATQEAFFSGIAPQLQQLTSTVMPLVQQTTTSIATSFNQMFKGVTNQLMTPETMTNLTGFAKNIGDAFRNLAPAVAPLTQAFAEIARVGSGFMPQLAQAASQAAQSFANFIHEAAQSGQLQQWISQGITVLRQMMSVVSQLGQLFLALGPEGVRVMNEIKTAVYATSTAVRLLTGDVSALKDVFPSLGDIAVNIFNRINAAIDTLLLGPLRLAIGIANKIPGVNIPEIPHLQQATTPSLSGGPLGGGGPGLGVSGGQIGYPSGDPNRPMQWVPGQGWQPAFGGGNLPVPMGDPSIGGGLLRGSASAHGGSGAYTWGNPPPKSGRSDTGLPSQPQVPYDTTLPAGYANLPQTSEIVGAENSWMDARNELAQKQARLNQLEKDNNAKEDDRIKARNDVIQAQQAQQQAELRLQDAANNLYKKQRGQLDTLASQFGEIGVALDKDLGISKGLPGLADNLVRFLASLAVAPLEGQLSAVANAPGQAQGGYGLMGILGAQGAFGPQYTYAGQQAAAASSGASPSALGPTALQPGVGGSNVDAMYALAQGASGRTKYGPASDLAHGLADCSGSVSDLVEVLQTGQSSPARLFDTTAFATDAGAAKFGFLPGYQPGAFNIGVNPYPGQSGHMAATLPNGVNFEGGGGTGGGGQYGGSAAGALNPEFEKHYYRPVGAGGAPSMATAPGSSSYGSSPSFPVPLPVTIVGGGGPGLGAPGLGGPGAPGTPGDPYATGGAPGLTSPANTNPALNNPPAPGGPGWGGPGLPTIPAGGGGGSGFMGLGGPMVGAVAGAPTQIGGVDPLQGSGKGGGPGIAEGGSLDTAMGLAASAVPGLGQAAQTGMKLANRAIQYGGQVAGILTEGALDTWLPFGGSKLAQNSWFSKIIGGIAGAAPTLPNMAGKPAAQPANNQQGQQPQGPVNNTTNINVTNQRATEDGTGKDIAYHQGQAQLPPGMP